MPLRSLSRRIAAILAGLSLTAPLPPIIPWAFTTRGDAPTKMSTSALKPCRVTCNATKTVSIARDFGLKSRSNATSVSIQNTKSKNSASITSPASAANVWSISPACRRSSPSGSASGWTGTTRTTPWTIPISSTFGISLSAVTRRAGSIQGLALNAVVHPLRHQPLAA